MFAFADTDGDGSLSFQEFEVTINFKSFSWPEFEKKEEKKEKD